MLKKLILISLFYLAGFSSVFFIYLPEKSHAQQIYIDVGAARVRKSLLAMPAYQPLGAPTETPQRWVGSDLFSIIQNDLDVSGLFKNISPNAFIEDPAQVGLRPQTVIPNGFDFSKWKSIDTEFLIRGGYQIVNDEITLEIYAYYVPQAQLIVGKKYQGPKSAIRKLAHTFANDFVKAVTGKPTFFLSQIVVTVDGGPQTFRELYIADWDGYNAIPVTSHRSITVSPAWSRDGKYIAYTAFVKRRIGNGPTLQNPDMFIYETSTLRRWLVSYRKGMNSGAEFFPDAKNLFVTLSQGRAVDIYKMSLDGKTITQITRGPGSAMNVEPAISPDGRTVAFSSDRSGRPMIYTMDINGGNVQRRTFAGHYNSTPSWSPDGKKLAFAGFDKEKDNFDVFLMNADGTGLSRLTSARKFNNKWSNNEDPTFSPDGQHVLFVSDRTGTRQLHMVNIDGSNERQITFDKKFYGKPKWGPLVQ